jgi:hypothetical protein
MLRQLATARDPSNELHSQYKWSTTLRIDTNTKCSTTISPTLVQYHHHHHHVRFFVATRRLPRRQSLDPYRLTASYICLAPPYLLPWFVWLLFGALCDRYSNSIVDSNSRPHTIASIIHSTQSSPTCAPRIHWHLCHGFSILACLVVGHAL